MDDHASTADVAIARDTFWSLDNLGNWSADETNGSFIRNDDTDGDGLYGTDDDPDEDALMRHHAVDHTNQDPERGRS